MRDGADECRPERIRFKEHLTECERRGRFGVVTTMQLPCGDTLRWFDFDLPITIINGQNVMGQRREPKNPHYLHAEVMAQVGKIQGHNLIRNDVLICNREM